MYTSGFVILYLTPACAAKLTTISILCSLKISSKNSLSCKSILKNLNLSYLLIISNLAFFKFTS